MYFTASNICLKYLSATGSDIVLVFSSTLVIGPFEQYSRIIAFLPDLVSIPEVNKAEITLSMIVYMYPTHLMF